jgi:hypothetical protein
MMHTNIEKKHTHTHTHTHIRTHKRKVQTRTMLFYFVFYLYLFYDQRPPDSYDVPDRHIFHYNTTFQGWFVKIGDKSYYIST